MERILNINKNYCKRCRGAQYGIPSTRKEKSMKVILKQDIKGVRKKRPNNKCKRWICKKLSISKRLSS